METVLELKGVVKSYGATMAIRSLDLSVARASICGLIGPNGAGKTTTIRMIMSIVMPDSGEISVLGCRSAVEAKDRIGYLPEERGVYPKMKVGEYLVYIAELKGLGHRTALARVREQLARVGLAHTYAKRLEELSKGMVQKVQFLAAILHEPDLLILDEPFSGLDPVSMRSLREMIMEQRERGAAILFSTHIMSYAEELCDKLVMIAHGEKVLDSPMSSVCGRVIPRTVVFEPLDPEASMAPIESLPAVEMVERAQDGTCRILLRESAEPNRTIAQVADLIPLARIELMRPRLEDIFLKLSGPQEARKEASAPLVTGEVS